MKAHSLVRQLQNKLNLNSPMSPGPIGVYFGNERIDMVQFDTSGADRRIRTASSVPYPIDRDDVLKSPAVLKKIVTEAFKEHPFSGRNIVTSLPPNMLQVINLQYRCNRDQTNANALIKAVRERFGDKIEASVIDFLPIRPRVEDQVDRAALVAIAEQETVVSFLESLRKSGFAVDALEIGPVAVKRLLTNLHDVDDNTKKIMAINVAELKSFVTVLWHGELLLDREVSIGLESIISDVMDSLSISDKEARMLLQTHGLQTAGEGKERLANSPFDQNVTETLVQIVKPTFLRLAEEINKVLIYTASETQGTGIDKIYILGGVSRWEGVDTYLSKLITRPVTKIHPFFGFSVKDSAMSISELDPISGISVATGLSLRGIDRV